MGHCYNGYCSTIVTDEDSTTHSKMSHCTADLITAIRMIKAECQVKPKIKGRLENKKDDHRELPLDHPAIEKLSDPIHYMKNYKSELYNLLVSMAKSKSETCKVDAMRLSRNLAYMVAQHTPGIGTTDDCTFEKSKTAGTASFEHHWNNHQNYVEHGVKPNVGRMKKKKKEKRITETR
jgi:hypothetical protein